MREGRKKKKLAMPMNAWSDEASKPVFAKKKKKKERGKTNKRQTSDVTATGFSLPVALGTTQRQSTCGFPYYGRA